ncbi:Capsule polysaccharide modification protein LipA [Pseudodesulfovibrio profundus]|uniref:Capsule polysaccharide modification protein LipA n=1 Tax=Pseudodesulfovibrio profundus TaxID=57320 RepID=A0A2C8FCB1_9BACT|nr:capsular polysaccharide biosynthesis protein [Pseudodesulfovibrio profundus]SOB60069.1 Capsule polysaccharide modification protein LipA [Pseudodesulfovibrio profundus]
MIGCFSRGMRDIPFLDVFLDDQIDFSPNGGKALNAIVGWGHKQTARKARQKAAEWNLPYLAVEDGFLRSVGLGVHGCPPLSVVVDDVGIYYDATQPSRLENILIEGLASNEVALAKEAMAAIRHTRLSKYNHAPELPEGCIPDNGKEKVLLVDQTRFDASVELGLADESSFVEMMRVARESHPDAELYVKIHPDVSSGKKRGYLTEMDLAGTEVVDFDVNPLSLVEKMDHVYAVTSQLGFEALVMGCNVYCFGMPFYAGWGVTNDRLHLERRDVSRTLEEIFAGAYVRYARYIDPYFGECCDVMRAIDILGDQKRHEERNHGDLVCAGFSWWRKGFAKHFFKSTSGNVLFRRGGDGAARLAEKVGGKVVFWSAKTPAGTIESCQERSVPAVGVEDGFLRSSGLGSDFFWPYSICMDSQGAYYDPSEPSDLETILRETDFDERILVRARALVERIVGSGVTKYNVGGDKPLAPFESNGKRVVLVVGQVEDDKSVQLGGQGIHSDRELLAAVRKNRPEAYIVYKPHPDVTSGNRSGGAFSEQDSGLYDHMESSVSLSALFSVIDELHTLTSLSGFEALLRGVPVVTYGGPFYAGWGLTKDRLAFSRRNRQLDIFKLVAGVLIMYPSYYDWQTELFCGPEVVLDRLARRLEPKQGAFRRRVCKAVDQAVRYIHR